MPQLGDQEKCLAAGLWPPKGIDPGDHGHLLLCSYLGGVNDDPEIPSVGGWSMMSSREYMALAG